MWMYRCGYNDTKHSMSGICTAHGRDPPSPTHDMKHSLIRMQFKCDQNSCTNLTRSSRHTYIRKHIQWRLTGCDVFPKRYCAFRTSLLSLCSKTCKGSVQSRIGDVIDGFQLWSRLHAPFLHSCHQLLTIVAAVVVLTCRCTGWPRCVSLAQANLRSCSCAFQSDVCARSSAHSWTRISARL